MQGRKLNLLDATLLVAGSMIGSGIFITPAEMTRELGSAGWLLLAWLFTGLITVLASLNYGELAAMMPKAGGQYVYISRAFGKMWGFVYGWSVFSVIQTGVIAAVAVAFANYLGVIIPAIGPNHVIFEIGIWHLTWAQIVAVLMVIFLTWINSKGIQGGKWIQRIFTTAKLLALFLLIILGIYYVFSANTFSQNWQGAWDAQHYVNKPIGHWESIGSFGLLLGFGTALVGSLFSADAWNNVTFIAGEIDNPSKNIGKSLLIGTAVVTIIYFLANVAYLAILPLKGNVGPALEIQGISHAANDRVGTAAATVIFGKYGNLIMALLIVISTFGCNNGLILAGARLYKSMADDKLFFKQASELNHAGVPHKALWIQAIWAGILCLTGSYLALIVYCTFASLLFYIITIYGVIVLRKREPDAERPYKVWAYPTLTWAYILLASLVALVLLYTKFSNTAIGLAIVAAGIPLYYFINKWDNSVTTENGNTAEK